jgi:hypothetical protein
VTREEFYKSYGVPHSSSRTFVLVPWNGYPRGVLTSLRGVLLCRTFVDTYRFGSPSAAKHLGSWRAMNLMLEKLEDVAGGVGISVHSYTKAVIVRTMEYTVSLDTFQRHSGTTAESTGA